MEEGIVKVNERGWDLKREREDGVGKFARGGNSGRVGESEKYEVGLTSMRKTEENRI